MNIDINSRVTTTNNISTTTASKNQTNEDVKFSDELSNLASEEAAEDKPEDSEKIEEDLNTDTENVEKTEESNEPEKTDETGDKNQIASENSPEEIDEVIDGLEGVVAEMNNKFNQQEENKESEIKEPGIHADKNIKNEGNALINNDMNIQEQKDLMFQMNANMNFNSDGQPFSNFMNNQNEQKLSSSANDIAEENAILSTMSENIAMANRNRILNENESPNNQRVKTVTNSEGVKRVDKQSNVTVETIVKYDSVIMNESDVDFFVKLVENGQAEMSQATQKSSNVSKTLADLLAKSMKDNQPVRIDFDNNISVIIKISRDGKISADFLPSSQVAEAYLRENLPLLRQKFDDNNIDYDELNHRQQKQNEKENQKKEQKDE